MKTRGEIFELDMKEIIEKINALYHKRVTVGLTSEEEAEQAALRKSYLDNIRATVQAQLDKVEIVDEAEETDHHDDECGCGHCHH